MGIAVEELEQNRRKGKSLDWHVEQRSEEKSEGGEGTEGSSRRPLTVSEKTETHERSKGKSGKLKELIGIKKTFLIYIFKTLLTKRKL